jgi:DNA-binding transcriptional MerR regulator
MRRKAGMTGRSYRISELAAAVGATPRAIRHYEQQGLLAPARIGAVRVYSDRDRRRLQLILKGVRVGFSLAGLREMLDTRDLKGDASCQRLTHAIEQFDSRIGELERQRADIDSMLVDLHEGRAQIEIALSKRGHKIASHAKRPKLIGYGLQPADE